MITLNSHKQYRHDLYLNDGGHLVHYPQRMIVPHSSSRNQNNPYWNILRNSQYPLLLQQKDTLKLIRQQPFVEGTYSKNYPKFSQVYFSYTYNPLTNKLNDKWIIVAKSNPTKIPLFLQTFQKWMKVNVHKIWIPDCNRNLNAGYGSPETNGPERNNIFSEKENPYAMHTPYISKLELLILFLNKKIGKNLISSSIITSMEIIQKFWRTIKEAIFERKIAGTMSRKPRANMASPPCFIWPLLA